MIESIQARPRERVLDQIRKTLALAQGTAGTPEGETAARIARDLMARHAVVEADLGGVPDLVGERGADKTRDTWRRALVVRVAEFCGCQIGRAHV